MSDPSNSNPGLPPSDDLRPSANRQETLLLSDVPNPTQLTQEISAPAITNPTLSSTALAALSQRYDILGEAGHGAMGNVYKARDRETGETVALKLLKPEIASDQAMMDRFKNELLFARKITHKNVCRVHEFNRIGGVAYTSMEFVEGESLRVVLNRFGGFPVRKGVDLALQICSGLKEAHAQGIVHRDLKPENVMIDTHGNVKIMDFGIARSMEALTRLTGSMIGTPAYMAPEQVAGKPVDYRTDIYSLGLILYEMFTGSQAFQADTAVAIALKQMRETPPSPHQVEPSIPVPIERIILKCLEKEPAKRFQSIADLAAALRSPMALGPNPVAQTPIPAAPSGHVTTAIPPVLLARTPEPKRASPLLWILLGALLVLGALGGLRAKTIWDSAEQIAPPVPLPAPKAPDIDLVKVVTQPIAATPAPAKTTPKPSAQPSVPAEAKSTKASAPQPPAAVQQPASPARPGIDVSVLQKRSEQVLSRDGLPGAKAGPGAGTGAEAATTYLWVGRYGKEDGAQKAAKKIEDLGLPVVVIPRHGPNGEAYVVFSGPFGQSRAWSVTRWLEAQGFKNVRSVHAPFGNQKANDSQQNPKP